MPLVGLKGPSLPAMDVFSSYPDRLWSPQFGSMLDTASLRGSNLLAN